MFWKEFDKLTAYLPIPNKLAWTFLKDITKVDYKFFLGHSEHRQSLGLKLSIFSFVWVAGPPN